MEGKIASQILGPAKGMELRWKELFEVPAQRKEWFWQIELYEQRRMQ
jgi:hypothetical protein